MLSQSIEGYLVSYIHHKNHEKGTIVFVFHNNKTLLINNYNAPHGQSQSNVLLTAQGLSVKLPENDWKISYIAYSDFPTNNQKEFKGYSIEYQKFEDTKTTIEIWLTKDIPFYNSKFYWAFLGDWSQSIENLHSQKFPVAIRINDKVSGQTIYEHSFLEKVTLNIQSNIFRE